MRLNYTACIIMAMSVMPGCATAGKFQKHMDSLVGTSIDAFIDQGHYPTGTFDKSNGNKVYVYSDSTAVPVQMFRNSQVDIVNLSCRVYIETNPFGMILGAKWEGNNCVSKG